MTQRHSTIPYCISVRVIIMQHTRADQLEFTSFGGFRALRLRTRRPIRDVFLQRQFDEASRRERASLALGSPGQSLALACRAMD